MARNVGTVISNNLSKGLITEATGLNFPDNAVVDARNTIFEKVGKARRRKGIDIEGGAETLQYDESDGVIREFIWQSVHNLGGFTFLVMQIGANIHFFELTVNTSLSGGVQPNSIDLNQYKAAGAGDIRGVPASLSSGAGYLFVTHPNCDPVAVRFNIEDNTFEIARLTILLRDFEGVEDNLGISENPASLSSRHHYNLKNQGWHKYVRIGSHTNEIASGSGNTDNEVTYPISWTDL